jgi:hypothetical protein
MINLYLLFFLFHSVVLVQAPVADCGGGGGDDDAAGNRMVGTMALLCIVTSSGFAGMYVV